MLAVHGFVKDKNGVQSEWVGYHASSSFVQLVDAADGTKVPTPSELVADVSVDGNFSVALPDQSAIDATAPITVRVLAPAGEQLAARDFALPDITGTNENDVFPFEVVPQAIFEIAPSQDPFLGGRPKITGRVLDVEGQRLVANRQVLVFGVRKEANSTSGARNAGVALVVARTDPQGYFSADYPRETDLAGNPGGPIELAEAWAVVAGALDPSGAREIPVQLVDAAQYTGVLPRALLLVVDVSPDAVAAAADGANDCACATGVPRVPDAHDLTASPSTYSMDLGGGRCVNLTTPNRAVEEFGFYTAVRTTDPQILGLGDVDTLVATPAPILNAIASAASAMRPETRTERTTLAARPAIEARVESVAAAKTGILAAGIDPRILANHIAASSTAATNDVLEAAQIQSAKRAQLSVLRSLSVRAPSRAALTASNPIDWDSDEPRFYEATTIAHGHLLHMKQVWRADGYSLGDLLYSLPLAPAQKKQIAIVDWERRESAARSEALSESEGLQNVLTRDRDISEIVSTTLGEHMHGDSSSFTAGYGQGQGAAGSGSYSGFSFGAVSGSAFGGGYSSANANQDASRDLAANALQRIRDTTLQAASAVRNQRSTVIQTVNQGESVQVTTEVVANHNHCHAMTVEYFEVLRHFQVSQELADVQECLFVPLLMAQFDTRKALRWRDILFAYLRKPELAPGFDALDRINTNYVDANFPVGTYADETVRSLEGTLTVEIRMPTGGDAGVIQKAWDAFSDWLTGSDASPPKTKTTLQIEVVDASGTPTQVPMEFTLVSELADRTPLYVRMQQAGAWASAPTRARIDRVRFYWTMKNSDFPDGTQLIIRSGTLRYRTAHFRSHTLFSEANIDSGLASPEAWVDTPLDEEEQRNPRHEDSKLARLLLAQLNEHIEYYHKAIWWSMDVDRRFMLLDGFIAPNSNGRSVASVVENRLIGFIGNSMVFPVGPGIHLDPSYRQDPERPVDLLNLYAPTMPIAPMRVSVPTRGVFAEAVMGECNACESMDETRFWRWDQAPSGDEPTPIASPSTDTRATPDPNLTAKDFPSPIVNIQNAPAEPDPTGLAAALKVIGTPNLFRDVTGLDQTQKNSLAAMQAALDAAKHFGDQAASLVQQQAMQKGGIDKSLQSIGQAKRQGLVNDTQANDLTVSALKKLVGGNDEAPAKKTPVDDLVPSLKNQVDRGGVKSLKATTTAGDNVEAEFAQPQLILASANASGNLAGNPSATTSTAPAVVANLPLGFDLNGANTIKAGVPLGLADFQDLVRKGRSFLIAKIGGTKWNHFVDTSFPRYWPLLQQAGMIRGGYYWFNANDTVDQQIDQTVNAVERLLPGDLAPSMDLEDEADSKHANQWPLDSRYAYRSTNAGMTNLKRDVRKWLDTVETRLGRTPIIYTGATWRDDLQWTDFTDHPLWTPHRNRVAPTNKILRAWDDYAIWQYAADGDNYLGQLHYHEKGIAIGGVDFDAYNGTMYGLRGLADIGRPGVAIVDANVFVTHAELDDHLHLLAGAGSAWTDTDLSGSDIPGGGADPVLVASNGALFAYFRTEGRLIEATTSAASAWTWTTTDLSEIAGAAAVHDPRVVFDGDKRYVVYWGKDASDEYDFFLLTFDSGWASVGLLRAAKLGDPSGQPVVYLHQGLVHVAGRVDGDGHLFEIWPTASGFASEDVSAQAIANNASTPAATYSPTAYETTAGLSLVYRAVGGSLWQIDRSTNVPTNITAAAGAGTIPCTGHPSAFVLGDVPHVVYRGLDGLVYDLWQEGGSWKVQPVCDDAVAADPVATSDGTRAAVAVRAQDGMIDVAIFDGVSWTCGPTKRADVTPPPPIPPDDGVPADDGTVFA